MYKNLNIIFWGFLIGLFLWFSGLDARIQWMLNETYNHNWNQTWRFIGDLGLGRTQIFFALFMVCYITYKTVPPLYRPHMVLLPFWLIFAAFILFLKSLVGKFTVLKTSVKHKPYKVQDDLIKSALVIAESLPNKAKMWLLSIPVVMFAGSVCYILKVIFGRPRPKMMLWHDGMYEATWFNFSAKFHSFPSGHTVTTFAFLAVMLAIYPQHKVYFIMAACLLAVSRVAAVTPHFTGDIVAGAALGYAIGMMLIKAYRIHK